MTEKRKLTQLGFWILKSLLANSDDDVLIGDFEEIYTETVRKKGTGRAVLWYWSQIIRLIPVYLINNIKWSATMFANYLKVTYRNITKNKGFSFITMFGLATGLAAFILIALYIQFELSFDRYHENAGRIYRMVREKPSSDSSVYMKTAVTPAPLAPAMKTEFPEVSAYTRLYKNPSMLIRHGNESFAEDRLFWVDKEIFNMFSFQLIMGDPKTVLEDPFSIVMSESTAKKYFGKQNPLGQVVNTFEGNDFIVKGIFKDIPANSHFVIDVMVPYETFFKLTRNSIENWGSNFTYTYIMIREGTDYKALEEKCPAFLDKYVYRQYNVPDSRKSLVKIQPLTSIHLYSRRNQELEKNNDITNIILFSSLALLFLLIACINYMNLATARATKRRMEVGIRKAVGAHRKQLIKQFLGESLTMTFLAMVFSFIMVQVALPFFNRLVGRDLSFNPVSSPRLFLVMLAIVLFVGLLSGSYPAFRISRYKLATILRGSSARSSRVSPLRNLLVLIQFAITIIFLTFTFIIRAQFNFVKNRDMGYSRDQILVMKVQDPKIIKNMASIRTELERYSDISMVSTSYRLPNNIDEHCTARWPGMPPDNIFNIYYNMADYHYLELFDIKLAAGRNFSRDFPSDANGAFLVNEAAVRAARWKNPVGQEFSDWMGNSKRIVGVVKDFHLHSLHRPIEPMYIYLTSEMFSYISIKINGTNIPKTIDHVKGVIGKIVPGYPFEYTFFDEVFARDYATEQRMGVIFSGFSILAMIVACLGLLGLSSYAAEQRFKEIGIRKVMGASEGNIFVLLSKEFLRWVVLANLVAWPVSFLIIRQWLQGYAYRVNIGILIFAFATILAIIIAVFTVSYQTIKAARTNPVKALRYE